jgi:hypothetical protein
MPDQDQHKKGSSFKLGILMSLEGHTYLKLNKTNKNEGIPTQIAKTL